MSRKHEREHQARWELPPPCRQRDTDLDSLGAEAGVCVQDGAVVDSQVEPPGMPTALPRLPASPARARVGLVCVLERGVALCRVEAAQSRLAQRLAGCLHSREREGSNPAACLGIEGLGARERACLVGVPRLPRSCE